MNLVELSIRRRVTITMITVTLVLFGFIGLSRLKVNLLPDLSYPTLTVRTELTGAAPAEIENLLSEPIEEALGVVKNLRRLKSVSRTGQSDVILEFAWGTDMGEAGLDVREKLEILQLPLEATRPLLLRFNPSTDPVLRLGLSGATTEGGAATSYETLKELRRFADEELRKRLEPVPGVAAVKISGGLEDEIQVDIDQQRLAQLGIDTNVVIERLRQENVNVSGGRLEEGAQRFLVRTINQFSSTEEMENLLITTTSGAPVRLRDVATVRQGYKERQAIIRIDGRESVEVAIYKEGDANTVSVADGVLERLEREHLLSEALAAANKAAGPDAKVIRSELPANAKLDVVDDQSVFIRNAVNEVLENALWGGLLSILVIYFFLGEAWGTLIIALSLPVSIIATFFVMQQLGITLNVMSLGGLALATGMVVDNANVVLENVQRLREQGMGILEAATKGSAEVSMAITAATLCTVAVFFPLVFVEGIAGQLFGDQALTVTVSMLISLFVALTLIPMLASLGVRSPTQFEEEGPHERAARAPLTGWKATIAWPFKQIGMVFGYVFAGIRFIAFHILRLVIIACRYIALAMRWILWPFKWATLAFYGVVARGYAKLLPWSLRHGMIVLAVAGSSLLFAAMLVPQLGLTLIPEFSQGSVELTLKLPPGTPLAATDAAVASLQQRGVAVEGVKRLYAVSGSGTRLDANPTEAGENIGHMLIQLQPGVVGAREAEVVGKLRELAETIPGATSEFARPELFSFATPLEIEISGYDLDQLREGSERVAEMLRSSDRFSDVRNTLEQGAPEIRIHFDQDKAASLGLTVKQISDQVVRKVRGEVATKYSFRDRKIDVLVRARETDRTSLEAIRRLIVNPTSARPVTLESVATVDSTIGPAEIRRIDQERVAVVSSSLAYGDLGTAVLAVERMLAEQPLAGVDIKIAGQNEEMQSSVRSLMFALALAVFLVYLVMASQFESLLHPFLILFTIPLALVGAVLALWLSGDNVSIVVFIGLIMLAGIVVNNAIVLIDRINQLRGEGVDTFAAIVDAGTTRLRPIVMTTLTTLLGFLPMAMALGEGSEVRQPMAITVIGGLTVSTLLTLVVIPVMYWLVTGRRKYVDRRSRTTGELIEQARPNV